MFQPILVVLPAFVGVVEGLQVRHRFDIDRPSGEGGVKLSHALSGVSRLAPLRACGALVFLKFAKVTIFANIRLYFKIFSEGFPENNFFFKSP